MTDADRGSGDGVWTAGRRVVTVLLAVALVTATVPVGSVVGAEDQRDIYTVSAETKAVIEKYLDEGEGARVQYPYEYEGEQYVVVTVKSDLSGISAGLNYYPEKFTRESFSNDLTEVFVVRISGDPALVPPSQRETLRAVLRGRTTAETLYSGSWESYDEPYEWFVNYERETLDGPVADILYADLKAFDLLDSRQEEYTAALNAMVVSSREYRLLPERYAEQITAKSSAAASAATAAEISSEIADQKYVEVGGRRVSSELVQKLLEKFSDRVKRFAETLENSKEYTGKVTFTAAVADIILTVLEKKVYASERVEALVEVKRYAERTDGVSLDEDLVAAIETVQRRHDRGTKVAEKLASAVEENGIDLATTGGAALAKQFGGYIVSKSGAAAKLSTLLTSSSSSTILAGLASKVSGGLAAYQFGGFLAGRGGIYTHITRARWVRRARGELLSVGRDIRDSHGQATVAHHSDAQVLHSVRYLSSVSLATYYTEQRKTIESFRLESLLVEYEKLKQRWFGEKYVNEANESKEFANISRKKATRRLRLPVQPVLDHYPEVSNREPLSRPTLTGPSGQVDATETVTLRWDGASGATYDVYLEAGTDRPDRLVAEGVAGTQTSVSVDQGTSYSWKVVARDGSRQAESTVGEFSVATESREETPDSAFSAKSPSSGQRDIGLETTLRWDAPEPDRYAENYVYLDTDETPQDGDLLRSTRSEDVEVDDLEPGTTYYWQVVVEDDGERTPGPVWSFTTASQRGSISLSGVRLAEDEELVVDGEASGDHTESVRLSYYATAEEIASESGGEFDIRVVNPETGVVLGTDDSNTDSEGHRMGIELRLHDQALFKTPGEHELKLIARHHTSGDKAVARTTVDVKLAPPDDEALVLPERPTTDDEVTLDAGHLNADSYKWDVKHEETLTVEVDGETGERVSFEGSDEVPDDPYEQYEYEVVGADGEITDGDVGIVDEEDFYEPEMSVGEFQVTDSVVAGNPVEASVEFTNAGRGRAHYIVRWKVDGRTVSSAAETLNRVDDEDEDPHDDTEPETFSLRPGDHRITAVVIDARGERHEFTERVTVRDNSPPTLSRPSPADGRSVAPTEVTLSWRGDDPEGDAVTYNVTLEAGDSTPDETVASGLDTPTFDPSELEPDTTYYWQVTATDEYGRTTTGPVWTFDTAVNEPPELLSHRAPSETTVDQTARYTLRTADPDGDTVTATLEAYSPTQGWIVVGDRTVDSDRRAVWEVRPFVGGDEGRQTRYRVRYDDGNGHTGTWGPFDGPTVRDDDTDAPSVYDFDYPVETAPGESIRVTFAADDRSSEIESASVSYTLPDGRSGTKTATNTGDRYAVTLPTAETTGEIEFTVTVTDADNSPEKTTSDRRTATVVDSATPTARLTAPQTATVGETVTFDATGSADPEASGLEFEFDVDGDGTYERTTNGRLSVTVDSPGDRTVGVRVTDASGDTDTATATVTVEPPANTAPTASLSVSETVTVGRAVTLDAAGSTDPDGEIVEYRFDTDGDGQPETTTDRPTTTVTYDEAKTYTPRVTVVDNDGTERTATATVTVEPAAQAPTATRELPDGVQPGERVTVTVRVPVDGEVNGLAVDEESTLPVVGQETAPQARYRSDKRQWLFVSVTDRTAVVNYTVRVPDDAAPGTQYTFTGEVSATDTTNATVGGDTALVVRRCPASAVAGDDDRIDLREIQRAIGAWADSEPVAGEVLDLRTVQRLIGLWADSERAACAG